MAFLLLKTLFFDLGLQQWKYWFLITGLPGNCRDFIIIIFIFLFWLHHVACGIALGPLALEAQSLNHWTTREFPRWLLIHFTVLCNHHPYLIAEHFHHSQKLPIKLSHPNTRQPLIYFLSLWICLFWTFRTNRSTQHMAFVSGFFHSAWWFQGPSML